MTTSTSTDLEQIRETLAACYAAWKAGDAAAFAAQFTPDATSARPGSFSRGRDQIRETMAAGFAGRLRGTTPLDKAVSTRFPTPDVGVAVTESAVLLPGETEAPADRVLLATWVVVRDGDRWLIAAYHNCALNA